MGFFDPDARTLSARHRRVYALYELAYTAADFSAAMLFLIGSVMFFYDALRMPATWCFVLGSALFALKPTLRVIRELHFLAIGDYRDLAERAEP
ncbi:MAG TPA: YrhK family protein [Devosiaceae bacterium]